MTLASQCLLLCFFAPCLPRGKQVFTTKCSCQLMPSHRKTQSTGTKRIYTKYSQTFHHTKGREDWVRHTSNYQRPGPGGKTKMLLRDEALCRCVLKVPRTLTLSRVWRTAKTAPRPARWEEWLIRKHPGGFSCTTTSGIGQTRRDLLTLQDNVAIYIVHGQEPHNQSIFLLKKKKSFIKKRIS